MTVRGFKTAAVAAGIKANGVLDLALICSDTPATAAAVFTQNTFIAPPLIVSRKHLEETVKLLSQPPTESGVQMGVLRSFLGALKMRGADDPLVKRVLDKASETLKKRLAEVR